MKMTKNENEGTCLVLKIAGYLSAITGVVLGFLAVTGGSSPAWWGMVASCLVTGFLFSAVSTILEKVGLIAQQNEWMVRRIAELSDDSNESRAAPPVPAPMTGRWEMKPPVGL